MKNSEALVVLSDAIDLQRETVALLREALATLKAAIDELKASRVPTYTPITSWVPPTTVPYKPQQPYIGDPSPYTKITCGGTKTISNEYTSQSSPKAFIGKTGISLDGGRTICGKSF